MALFRSTAGQSPQILSKDRERIIAYALTPAGVRRLRESGVRHGRNVPGRVLAALIRSGDAHSPRPADAAGQKTLFDDDTPDHLPRCELTGVVTDLHLIVYGEGQGIVAKLVGSEPRFLLQKATVLSIPLAALSPTVLDTLETIGKVPLESAAVRALRAWLRQDGEAAWRKLERELGKAQQDLNLGPAGDELPLGDAAAERPGGVPV